MKKYAKLITAILLVSLLALTLFACVDSGNDTEGKMTLVLIDGDNVKEYVIDLSRLPSGENKSTGLIAVLDYLQNDGKLTYSAEGTLLTKVGDLESKPNESKYVWLYTDVAADVNVSQWANQINYKGKTYTDSNVGAYEMSVKSGCTIIITYLIFS